MKQKDRNVTHIIKVSEDRPLESISVRALINFPVTEAKKDKNGNETHGTKTRG